MDKVIDEDGNVYDVVDGTVSKNGKIYEVDELLRIGKVREYSPPAAEAPAQADASPAQQDNTRLVLPDRIKENGAGGFSVVADLLNPFIYTEKGSDVEGPMRPFAMAAGALADAGLTLAKPVGIAANAIKAAAKGSRIAKPVEKAANFIKNDLNQISMKKNFGANVVSRAENALYGAADGMLATGDISPVSAAAGALFGGALGGNAAMNAKKAEKEFSKFARAPSYQQRWAKDYLKSKGVDAKESPQAIRELVKREAERGEEMETLIARNNDRLEKLNKDMEKLLVGEKMGKINIGMGFEDFTEDIKNLVYKQGREIGSSEGEKIERAIDGIMKDIRRTQLEKKAERGELTGTAMGQVSARKFVKENLDNLAYEIPLTLGDVDELKRAMQKRTSMYKRSSAAQARAGVETRANAEGATAINKELDLLKDVSDDIRQQGLELKNQLGDHNFEVLNGALDFNELSRSKNIDALNLELYLKGDALTKYREINKERSELIGKNDIFETMLAKFEFAKPDDTFIPKGSKNNVSGNAISSEGTRAASKALTKAYDKAREILPNSLDRQDGE